MIYLAKMSEETKRVLIALAIIILLIFVLIGLIGTAIRRLAKNQGLQVDTFMHDVVKTRVVKTPFKFRQLAYRKNHRLLFMQAWVPFLMLLISFAFLVGYMGIAKRWDFNVFDYYGTDGTNGEGFTTLFFIFDFKNAPRTDFFGMSVVSNWPPVLNSPYLAKEAWPSYVFTPIFLVGAVWFLVCVEAYMARLYRIWVLSKKVFIKKLEDYDAAKNPLDPASTLNE
ncbi:MAG: hypothetical protein GX132_04740 [Erysipelotrichia bacterium]|jgi:hypothetical protein|nr:hypothetical protein [Erysipelotrichia bacterium]